MGEAADQVTDLIYGPDSQILYAGVELGIFEHVAQKGSKYGGWNQN